MKRILVVDNDRLMLEFMTELLSREGHEVRTAEDGLSALDILQGYAPDFIFVDLVMPNIGGKTLCRMIRARQDFRNTYLIVLSATLSEEKIDLTELGANACIAKGPFLYMEKHVLEVLNHPALAVERCLIGEVIGIEHVYPRSVTKELLTIKRHFDLVLERMSDGVLEINHEGRILYANRAALSLIGLPQEELLGFRFVHLFGGGDSARVEELVTRLNHRPATISYESPVRLNNRLITLDTLPAIHDRTTIIMGDVSELRRKVDALKTAERQFRNIIMWNSDAIVIVNGEGTVKFANPAAETLFGRKREELPGHPFGFPLVGGEVSDVDFVDSAGRSLVAEMRVVDIDWEGERASLASLRDITRRKRMEEGLRMAREKMAEMATRDELTGLYNRRYFNEALEREVARSKRYGSSLMVCMMDADYFKEINDSYGHAAGDVALSEIGRILKKWARQSDLPCRYGGDEFAAILPDTDSQGGRAACERLRETVAGHRFEGQGFRFRLTLSIGIAQYVPRVDTSSADLIKRADEALYRAKEKGRNRVE